MNEYFSFLVCQHPDKTDLYLNGLPIGVVHDSAVDRFKVHEFVMPDGSRKPLTFNTLVAPVPFTTLYALKSRLHDLIDQIQL